MGNNQAAYKGNNQGNFARPSVPFDFAGLYVNPWREAAFAVDGAASSY